MTPRSARRWGRRLLDLVGYAAGLFVAAVSLIAPVSVATGSGLVGVKVGLFLAGVACVGYATVLWWPSRSESDPAATPSRSGRDGRPTGFEALLDRVPPWRWLRVDPHGRFHPGTKLYAAAALLFGASFLLEAVFGVGV
ncbi:DUF7555 family protein [Haloplanus rubicundus]|uniref:Uncharacterized protein n=1 Tax=Haloplanus rubicundus TaxID=1547898 RepID=A0A345EBM0_9EURY|nr:hypothetical protein [Haloplanus rubicundus]AXG09592.1 hypothetical protein DU484_06750 [Haloplanus rubicundus]